jgi:putative oxidoreductase
VRRLFSNFAAGAPGLGLLLLRLAAGTGLMAQGVRSLRVVPLSGPTLLHVVMIGIGLLLLVGLWTPIAGAMLAILAIVHAALHLTNPWTCVLMGILGAALALLGPGLWSIDARLFGWKRIRIPDC